MKTYVEAVAPCSPSASGSEIAGIDEPARLVSVIGVRAFSGTLFASFAIAWLSWVYRAALLSFWISPVASRTGAEPPFVDHAGLALITFKVIVATTLLLAFPVFSAECWLVLCRMTRRLEARRLAAPFSLASAAALLLALWMARGLEFRVFVEFL